MDIPEEDEWLDLVDDADQVIGQKRRSAVYQERIVHVRVVNLFLVNAQGQLWIPRRTAAKKNFPLALDMSMGGHVKSGENYEQALARELQEELGLVLKNCPYQLLGYLTPLRDPVPAFMKVYEIRTDIAPPIKRAEFVEASWLEPQDVLTRIQNGDQAKQDLATLIARFYLR